MCSDSGLHTTVNLTLCNFFTYFCCCQVPFFFFRFSIVHKTLELFRELKLEVVKTQNLQMLLVKVTFTPS